MTDLYDIAYQIQRFLDAGGPVLYPIMFVLLVMWTLIFERLFYFNFRHPAVRRQVIETWNARADTSSWYAKQIRTGMISQVSMDLNAGLMMIKTLVALCPLLGLLGTVTGMIEVFNVLAITGSGNARAMASGVTRATIPTMAGMVAALSGLFFSYRLETYAKRETERVDDQLTHH
jgi:biopolymer transport protein ExbB